MQDTEYQSARLRRDMKAAGARLIAWSRRTFFDGGRKIASLRPTQSDAIAIARVICIVSMVYAHAWTGRTTSALVATAETPQGMFRWVVVELLGRSSVPLLGMISGWLVASSAMRRGYWNFVGGKARTILAPMLLWNALAVLIVSGSVAAGIIRGPSARSVEWVINEILGYATFNNINVQMTFLRDLFVCMVLAPFFNRLNSNWLVALMALLLAWSIGGWIIPLVLRPSVALFFLLGVYARRHHLAERVADMPFAYAALPFAILAPLKVALAIWGFQFTRENMEIAAAADIAMRLSAAMLVWRTAIALADTPALALLKRFEPYAFLLFCSHMIMIWMGGQTLGAFSGPLGAPGYPLFFILQPFLALAATILLGRFLMLISPRVASWLSGGRLRAEPRLRPVLMAA